MRPVSLAHLDTRDLGDRVPLVGGFERRREERGFLYGLRGKLRVDARGSQKYELFGVVAVGGVDDVSLDLEIDGDEVGGVSGVSVDATDFCRSEDHVFGGFLGEKSLDFCLAR